MGLPIQSIPLLSLLCLFCLSAGATGRSLQESEPANKAEVANPSSTAIDNDTPLPSPSRKLPGLLEALTGKHTVPSGVPQDEALTAQVLPGKDPQSSVGEKGPSVAASSSDKSTSTKLTGSSLPTLLSALLAVPRRPSSVDVPGDDKEAGSTGSRAQQSEAADQGSAIVEPEKEWDSAEEGPMAEEVLATGEVNEDAVISHIQEHSERNAAARLSAEEEDEVSVAKVPFSRLPGILKQLLLFPKHFGGGNVDFTPVSDITNTEGVVGDDEDEDRRALAQLRSSPCTVKVGPTEKFKKIQDALNSIGPNSKSTPKTICIAKGIYKGQVKVAKGQDGITFLGQGFSTIITASATRASAGGVFLAATLFVEGSFFTAKNLAVENSYQSVAMPNPAVTLSANQTTWLNVSLTSWSDTLSIRRGNSHLFKNCIISGSTDITWGFGRVAFVDTQFVIRDFKDPKTRYTGHIGTYGTDKNSDGATSGAVYWNCKIDGAGRTFLGRTYRAKCITVYANCYLGKPVVAFGWDDYMGYSKQGKMDYREYNSVGPGAATSRRFGKVYRGTVPAQYSVKSFIGRTS